MEQLSNIDPSSMNCDERLAFWINLYNALIMHVSMIYQAFLRISYLLDMEDDVFFCSLFAK